MTNMSILKYKNIDLDYDFKEKLTLFLLNTKMFGMKLTLKREPRWRRNIIVFR